MKSFQRLLSLDRNWPKLCEWLVRAQSQAKRQKHGGGAGTPSSGRSARGGGDAGARAEEEVGPRDDSDLYGVLGVTSDATEKQLKQAYRMMSLKYHPDKQGGSTRAFQLIATAYQTLSDAEKRRAYDEGSDMKSRKKRADDSSDSEDERNKKSLFEEVERKYFPERYRFWPFGDPFIEKRKIMARRHKEEQQRVQRQRAQQGGAGSDHDDEDY